MRNRRLRKYRVFPVLAALAAASAAAPAHASGPATQDWTSLAGYTDLNPCTGELVTFTRGTLHLLSHVTEDGSGGFHVVTELNGQAEGVSDSGARYVGTGANRDTLSVRAGEAPLTSTFTGMFTLLSRGAAENFALQAVYHVTVDARGRVTTEFQRFANGLCRG